jgi:hypothetical protein
MITAATMSLVLTLLQEAPSIYDALKADLDAVTGNSLTADQFTKKWTDMNILWAAAKGKWASA